MLISEWVLRAICVIRGKGDGRLIRPTKAQDRRSLTDLTWICGKEVEKAAFTTILVSTFLVAKREEGEKRLSTRQKDKHISATERDKSTNLSASPSYFQPLFSISLVVSMGYHCYLGPIAQEALFPLEYTAIAIEARSRNPLA